MEFGMPAIILTFMTVLICGEWEMLTVSLPKVVLGGLFQWLHAVNNAAVLAIMDYSSLKSAQLHHLST